MLISTIKQCSDSKTNSIYEISVKIYPINNVYHNDIHGVEDFHISPQLVVLLHFVNHQCGGGPKFFSCHKSPLAKSAGFSVRIIITNSSQ